MLMMPNEKPTSDTGWDYSSAFALRAELNAIISRDLQDLRHHLELSPYRRRIAVEVCRVLDERVGLRVVDKAELKVLVGHHAFNQVQKRRHGLIETILFSKAEQ